MYCAVAVVVVVVVDVGAVRLHVRVVMCAQDLSAQELERSLEGRTLNSV